MSLDIENFDEISSRGENLYKNINFVKCPYLQCNVNFNFQGLEHLKFKRRKKARSKYDQYMRFKVLAFVPDILSKSHTLQGIWQTKQFERIRRNSRTENILIEVIFYEFIAVVNNKRLKIIIKKVGENEPFFWSVIPFWGLDRDKVRRKMHSGNHLID